MSKESHDKNISEFSISRENSDYSLIKSKPSKSIPKQSKNIHLYFRSIRFDSSKDEER